MMLSTVLLLLAGIPGAGELDLSWAPEGEPTPVSGALGDYFIMPGAGNSGRPGDPALPAVPVMALLPSGAAARSITVRSATWEELPGTWDMKPVQRGVPLSMPGDFALTRANPEAYAVASSLPPVILSGSGGLMGYGVAEMVVRPVRWDAATGRAELLTSLSLTLHYDESAGAPLPAGAAARRGAADAVASMVLNPQDTGMYGPVRSDDDLPWGEYLIVTRDSLVDVFEPLARMKTMLGVPARIVTMEYVESNYTGVDPAQELRFFLRDIYDDSPPTWILLGGDTPLVPHRNCWATAEGYTGDPAADIYYMDMNDTAPGADLWDANGNGVWGEIEGDEMDYHPDYFVGRASVENGPQANLFVTKVMAYQYPEVDDTRDTDPWFTSMGFTTGILWYSPYCPGSAGKEKVDTLYTPAEWQPVIKHYESAGSQSHALTMEMLNRGMHLVNHAGHGSTGSVSIGTGSLDSGDFMGLTNISAHGRVSIWNTIACNSGGFDQGTCLAEAWLRSPQGGGFCMMNTRYGWGEPSEPGGQWSELVDQEFFAKFFTEDAFHLGEAHALAWDEFIPLIPTDTHYDWIAKSITLFGDPELPMWSTDYCDIEMVVSPGHLEVGPCQFTVTVAGGSDDFLEDARVCLLQGEWDDPLEYSIEYTDASGTACFDVVIDDGTDTAAVTAWARDHEPFTMVLPVVSTGVGSGVRAGGSPALGAPTPNPATTSVAFDWRVPAGSAELSVYDLSGRIIATPASGLTGEGTLTWGCETEAGAPVSPGLYFARLRMIDGTTLTRRLVVAGGR